MPLIATAALGVGQAVNGFIKKGKAKRMAEKNIRPEAQIAKPILDNQALSESRAGSGLSDSAKQLFTTNSDRALTASIDAILKSGGNPNMIGDIYDDYNTGASKMAFAEDEAKFRNINMLVRSNEKLAEEQDKVWGINKYAPWADRAREASSLSREGNQDVFSGANAAIGSWAGMETAKLAPTAGEARPMGTATAPTNGWTQPQPLAKMPKLNLDPNRVPFMSTTTPQINYTPRSNEMLNNLGILPIGGMNMRGMFETGSYGR